MCLKPFVHGPWGGQEYVKECSEAVSIVGAGVCVRLYRVGKGLVRKEMVGINCAG